MTDPTNPATVDDVVLERPLTADEEAVVPRWLDQSWTILQARLPGLASRMQLPAGTPGTVAEATVRQVLGSMVERKVRNPDGLRSWTADDVVSTIDQTLSTGQLYVTADELALLAVPTVAGGIYSIVLGR